MNDYKLLFANNKKHQNIEPISDLIAAIVKREPQKITTLLNPEKSPVTEIYALQQGQLTALKEYFEDLLNYPIKLAMKICDMSNIETTLQNNASRYDILHCLAQRYDELKDYCRQKGVKLSSLEDLLKYGSKLKHTSALYTFINGLSDQNKRYLENSLKRMQQKKAAEPTLHMKRY